MDTTAKKRTRNLTQKDIDYRNAYNKEKYDRMNFNMPKGKKALLQLLASNHGMKPGEYLNALIDAELKKERIE